MAVHDLDGWKAIANYLGKSVDTARALTRDGLPVRRLGTGSRAMVIAFRAEIDAWLRARPTVGSAA